MQDTLPSRFLRPRFDPIPRGDTTTTPEYDDIASLPDLIRFNCENNGEGIFCKQAVLKQDSGVEDGVERCSGNRYSARAITYGQVHDAVNACATWITRALPATQTTTSLKPVALYMESDVGLFIHLAALLDLGIPVSFLALSPIDCEF